MLERLRFNKLLLAGVAVASLGAASPALADRGIPFNLEGASPANVWFDA